MDPKIRLRLEAKERRRLAAAANGRAAVAMAARFEQFLAQKGINAGAAVALYWPHQDELDTRPLMARLVHEGHRVALPVVVAPGKPLRFRVWLPDGELTDGPYGIPAPGDDAPELRPDIVAVPLLAFDGQGMRLGYGGGYYDRTLRALRGDGRGAVRAVGLAFAAQEVDKLPVHEGDEPLDAVVTERAVHCFNREICS